MLISIPKNKIRWYAQLFANGLPVGGTEWIKVWDRPPCIAPRNVQTVHNMDGSVHHVNGRVLHSTFEFTMPEGMNKRLDPYMDWIKSDKTTKLEVTTWLVSPTHEKISPVEQWIFEDCFCQSVSFDGTMYMDDYGNDHSELNLQVRYSNIKYEHFDSKEIPSFMRKSSGRCNKSQSSRQIHIEEPEPEQYEQFDFFEGYFDDGDEGVIL